MTLKLFLVSLKSILLKFLRRQKMPDKKYIWYASYGSNTFRERFLCYIQGGQPKGSMTNYNGCRDKSLPISESPIFLAHDLYFAMSSRNWQRGGVCFVKTQSNFSTFTYGYMYLITKEQFCDVVRQEIKSETQINLDFDNAITNGNLVFKPDSMYGNLIFVGNKDNYPIFTFTNEINIQPTTKPSENYLTMIISGLIETHKLTNQEITEYLLSKDGILGNYSEVQLLEIINNI
jgi:hypothetical protein